MAIKEKFNKILLLENKRTEILFTSFSLIIQTIAIILIIQNINLFQIIIFWTLIVFLFFLVLIIIFQFLSSELTIESMGVTLQLSPEYNDSIEDLFSFLEIPSVSVDNNCIHFETLKFTIQRNSNSLMIKTSERTEKAISRFYKDLKIFRENFEEIVKTSNNSTISNLKFHCQLDLKIKGIKMLKKNGAEEQAKTFEKGLIIRKTKKEINVIFPENCKLKPWKELKKMMLN